MSKVADLIEQLETVACNVENLKIFGRNPLIQIVEIQLREAIKMANELEKQGGDD